MNRGARRFTKEKRESKMSTTALYVDYIIIGLPTVYWIIAFYVFLSKDTAVQVLQKAAGNIFSTVVLIAISYILGLITDRFSDLLFDKRKKRIRGQYLDSKNVSLAAWEKYNWSDFAKFTLSRIRILRSLIINSIFVSCTTSLLIYKFCDEGKEILIVVTILLGALSCIISNSGHINLLNNYYHKTQILGQ